MVSDSDIKFCPFCGCKDDIDQNQWKRSDGKTGPGCGRCGSNAEDLETWNTRPIEDALRTQLQAANERIEVAIEIVQAAKKTLSYSHYMEPAYYVDLKESIKKWT